MIHPCQYGSTQPYPEIIEWSVIYEILGATVNLIANLISLFLGDIGNQGNYNRLNQYFIKDYLRLPSVHPPTRRRCSFRAVSSQAFRDQTNINISTISSLVILNLRVRTTTECEEINMFLMKIVLSLR